MAQRDSSVLSEGDLDEVTSTRAARKNDREDSPLDARMLDLDDEAESPFLRGQKRVPVRRGALPRKAASRVKIVLILLLIATFLGLILSLFHRYAMHSWRFRLESTEDLAISGNRNVSRSQIMDVMASDIDRNSFFVPLEQRKKQLEQIPWVQSAAVMRLLPNRLKIVIQERTPVAFVEIGSRIELIDANGVIMELSMGQATRYSFPVIVGISDADPLSTRAARMKIYSQLMKDLDTGGANYSRDLSDVDLSDPDDVKATVTDPHGAVLVHLGSANFLERFKVYVAHVAEWRTQFRKLQSVDLRYEHQVIVNPDSPEVGAKTNAGGSENATNAAPTGLDAHKNRVSPPHRAKKHH